MTPIEIKGPGASSMQSFVIRPGMCARQPPIVTYQSRAD